MDNLVIEPGRFTPEIRFNSASGTLEIKGESYPENTSEFFKPVFEWLDEYLKDDASNKTEVTIELYYFNSSSSKILMNFFERLDGAAESGKTIVVHWVYEEDDEDSLEFGEEFAEDLDHLQFSLIAKRPDT